MRTPSPAGRLSHFDYLLPSGHIAQRPAATRDRARLLVSHPHAIEDRIFRHLPALLRPGDLLVLNDTRVVPARLRAKKTSGGRVALLLLNPLPEAAGEDAPETDRWLAMATSNKKIQPGWHVTIAPGFHATFLERQGTRFHVRLQTDHGTVAEAIQRHGHLPLPPYITDSDPRQDRTRYQTVFAHQAGAVAAPTAGLHFTHRLLAQLRARGIHTTTVTLHVGPGTFQPVREEDLSRHRMHRERCQLSAQTARRINTTRAQGGRIVAVGTTTLRVLESVALTRGRLHPFSGETGLFIRPGYPFRVVDALITNFHLPRSTLLMLVAALIGKRRLDRDYAHAIARGYRFYSYGDAMLLFPPDTRPTGARRP